MDGPEDNKAECDERQPRPGQLRKTETGCERAAEMRSELSASMSKFEIAAALRAAREWMTTH